MTKTALKEKLNNSLPPYGGQSISAECRAGRPIRWVKVLWSMDQQMCSCEGIRPFRVDIEPRSAVLVSRSNPKEGNRSLSTEDRGLSSEQQAFQPCRRVNAGEN